MAHTYKDNSLFINKLERKFRKKVNLLNRLPNERQKYSPFLDFLYEDEEVEQENSARDTGYDHTRGKTLYRNFR